MHLRTSISKKIILAFGLIIIMVCILFFLNRKNNGQVRNLNYKIYKVYNPSIKSLRELKSLVIRSEMLITNWVYNQSPNDAVKKKKLRELINEKYPTLKKDLKKLSKNWNKKQKEEFNYIINTTDTLFFKHYKKIMNKLNSFISYEDATIMYTIKPMIENGKIDKQSTAIKSALSNVTDNHRKKKNALKSRIDNNYEKQSTINIIFLIFILLSISLVAYITIRNIALPIINLRNNTYNLTKGILNNNFRNENKDEIGDINRHFNVLINALNQSSNFIKQIASGNYNNEYKLLSENDELGNALIFLQNEVKKTKVNYDNKINEKDEELKKQKIQIDHLYSELNNNNYYAGKIQHNLQPGEKKLKNLFKDTFVFYNPKNVVSGDFYWLEYNEDCVLIASIDCTGSGISGAMISVLCYTLLNNAVHERGYIHTASILDYLNESLINTLHPDNKNEPKETIDIAICSIDYNNNIIRFSGAFNPLLMIREGSLKEIQGDRFSVSAKNKQAYLNFTEHEIPFQKEDLFYIFTDGYIDQLGGEKGKKFSYENFKELILNNWHLSMASQKKNIKNTFESWKKDHEQVDDILVLGFQAM